MQPLKPPKTMNVYMLLRRSGLSLSTVASSTMINNVSIGSGFFMSQHDAEMYRTMELLKLSPSDNSEFFVFELELPNPAYKETE
jgi:hypothetical protein